jgi:hypothetical protein
MRTNISGKLLLAPAEEYSNPLSIVEIVEVCKQYSKLGIYIQHQIGLIMEFGIDEAIASDGVSIAALPHIKDFLLQISQNPYFGDACVQAVDCIHRIELFEDKNPDLFRIAN